MKNYVIGVDIGGSHITAALVDLDLKTVIKNTRRRERVEANGEAGRIITQWSEVIQSLIGHTPKQELRIGIAMPGPFDYEQGISYITGLNKYESLYGLPVKELIADVVGVSKNNILLKNDAACFLHGEMFAGAGRGCSQSVGITLGTGTGTAIHRFGETHDANLGPSPFLDSIADNYLSTRWFVQEYARRTGHKTQDVQQLTSHFETDQAVRDIFNTFGSNLALLLRNFITKEKPAIAIIGGNIANAWDCFIPETQQRLASIGITVPIIRAALGEDATMLGAASLFSEKDKQKPSPRINIL